MKNVMSVSLNVHSNEKCYIREDFSVLFNVHWQKKHLITRSEILMLKKANCFGSA